MGRLVSPKGRLTAEEAEAWRDRIVAVVPELLAGRNKPNPRPVVLPLPLPATLLGR